MTANAATSFSIKKKLLPFPSFLFGASTEKTQDAELKQLHSIVKNTKHNQKVGKRYMTLQDMIDYEKKESFEDEVLNQLMKKFNLSMKDAKAYLENN